MSWSNVQWSSKVAEDCPACWICRKPIVAESQAVAHFVAGYLGGVPIHHWCRPGWKP